MTFALLQVAARVPATLLHHVAGYCRRELVRQRDPSIHRLQYRLVRARIVLIVVAPGNDDFIFSENRSR